MYFYDFYYAMDDPLYAFAVLLFAVALILSIVASAKVKSNFKKYSSVYCGVTGAEAAERVLRQNGVYGVTIERVSGKLTDHFDPRTNIIRLSEDVYSSSSISAVGVACHEAGHAVQYAKNYAPIKLRAAIIPVTNIGSTLALPIVILGFLFSLPALSLAGVFLFGFAVLFQLITLPVEFNASRRAIDAIEAGYVINDISLVSGAKKVLTAAAMTYVAALLTSLAQFLRLLAIVNRRK